MYNNWQALNNMAVIVDKKVKIVDAGALKHYVKLLSPEYDKKNTGNSC